uniref:Small ribosomal subunit protein eS1 n=1 Tax=Arcella intermedia TaxID=1963864 RepID=A0A6B2LFD2_9EUKA|eukprot:TRINITY_DN1381_c0_g1_i1.p1 TRINITY_DN1381_c0_g1~~TRINITY_DN1381_c0_g1_i1.p1  ORF type:complete len:260 (-),score=70.47 TRINITY_DN1381_c0_g1_i1:59-838(-)
MAIGKNKRKPKKGAKKKIADPFAKKDWYDIRAPNMFKETYVGKTFVNQSQGKFLSSDALKGRVFSVSLADLNKDEDRAYRIIKLVCEEVHGNEVLTNFHGMTFTTDKVKSLVRKWQSLIEAVLEVKTDDGYVVRLFCIGFTKKRSNQKKTNSYAQSSQIRQIRKKMVDIMKDEATSGDLKNLFEKFISESIAKRIEKECQGIYPLQNVYIRKCKVLKKPRYDAAKLAEMHVKTEAPAAAAEDTGAALVPGGEAVPETDF